MFRMTYNERNLANIDKLADHTKVAAKKWYAFLLDNEIDLLIYETIRSEGTQRANVAKGASQTMRSYHIVGQALDFVPVNPKGSVNWAGYGSADVKRAVKKAKELGFHWGGDWTSFVDKPHLEFRHHGYGTDTFTKKVETETAGVVSTPEKTIMDKATEKIQKTLNSRYDAKLTVDGIPGSKTLKALVKGLQIELNKQYKSGLVVDGDFGRKTKASVPNVRKGAKGNITYILQASLYFEGNDPKGVDGIFGVGTEKAVKAFQEDNGLPADGIAGRDTFTKLFV